VLLPFMRHVHCACFNGLWGQGGLPLTGRQRCARAFARHPAAGWRALCTPHIGEGARWRGGEAPLGEPRSKLASCQFVMHGEMST
jgi:hypothetical protein